MRFVPWLAVVTFGAVGCGGNADSDGDGLLDADEIELGLDPEKADSDGDGLDDGEEIDLGADPLAEDSDGDGLLDGDEIEHGADPLAVDTDEDTYSDFHEVTEGRDPADADDRIYVGYWPYNPDKAALGSPSFTGEPIPVGQQFPPPSMGHDQFKDAIHLYDFANQGYVVIDASATWCGPCQATSAWLASGGAEDAFGYEPVFGAVRQAIDRGEVRWITFMTSNADGFGSKPADVRAWDEDFPHPNIPVINDPTDEVLLAVNFDGVESLFWPAFVVLDSDMVVVYRGGGGDTLQFLLDNM